MTLLAYHGLESKKEAILAQLATHRAADEIVKGTYWEKGKGCAVGCTLHSADHRLYEIRFGIPQMLAQLEDCIFEGLPNDVARLWPERFMCAIQPGADLALVGWKFVHWMLTDSAVNPGINHPIVRDAVSQCADVALVWAHGTTRSASAVSAAWGAAHAAESAAIAARGWAHAAESAAESAEIAARGAARGMEMSAARSATCAARSLESAAYVLMADKLISLLENVRPGL